MISLFDTKKMFGNKEKYTVPTKEEIDLVYRFVDSNFDEHPFTKISIKEIENATLYLHDRLFFIHRRGGSGLLIYGHSGTDNVDDLTLNLFKDTNYEFLIINAMTVASTSEKSLVQKKRSRADIDHSYDNLENYLLHALVNKYEDLRVFNIHGSRTVPNRNLWIINGMSKIDKKIKQWPLILAIVFVVFFPEIDIQVNFDLQNHTVRGKKFDSITMKFKRSGPTSSVIGRIVNSKSMNPKARTRDRGLYIHSENSITWASKDKNQEKIATAHVMADFYYTNWGSRDFGDAPLELDNFDKWFRS